MQILYHFNDKLLAPNCRDLVCACRVDLEELNFAELRLNK